MSEIAVDRRMRRDLHVMEYTTYKEVPTSSVGNQKVP